MLVRARGWGAIRIRTGIAEDRGSAPAKPTGQSSGPVISIPVLPATWRSWAAIVLPASGKGDQPVDQRRPGGGRLPPPLEVFPSDKPTRQTAAVSDIVDVRAGVPPAAVRLAVEGGELVDGGFEVSVDDRRVAHADRVRDGLLLQALAAIAKRIGLLWAQCPGLSSLRIARQCPGDGGVDPHVSPGDDPDHFGDGGARGALGDRTHGARRQARRQQHLLGDGRVDHDGPAARFEQATDGRRTHDRWGIPGPAGVELEVEEHDIDRARRGAQVVLDGQKAGHDLDLRGYPGQPRRDYRVVVDDDDAGPRSIVHWWSPLISMSVPCPGVDSMLTCAPISSIAATTTWFRPRLRGPAVSKPRPSSCTLTSHEDRSAVA